MMTKEGSNKILNFHDPWGSVFWTQFGAEIRISSKFSPKLPEKFPNPKFRIKKFVRYLFSSPEPKAQVSFSD